MYERFSIGSLYSLALAEGEGVGTAYEYYAKRLVLMPWLQGMPYPERILIAGLPEKYGSSLDLVQLASELQASLIIADDRPEALDKVHLSIEAAKIHGWFQDLNWRPILVDDISLPKEISMQFDLTLSSEVVQRIRPEDRCRYLARLSDLSSQIALFMPNAANPSHTNVSGLNGIFYQELITLLGDRHAIQGYIDMPPFPPGITRSESQREQAATGKLESMAMQALAIYARLERFVPRSVRARQSHIIYALLPYPSL